MKKINKLILFIVLVMSVLNTFSQEKNYVVIKYEMYFKNKLERIDYWITPYDSINSGQIKLYPLYLNNFSKLDLNECINNENINILSMSENEDYDLDSKLIDDIEILRDIINSEAQKITTIKKKWNNYKGVQKINIYMTPITGNFCRGVMSPFSGKNIDYEGDIFIPNSNFKTNHNFKNDLKYNLIMGSDFYNFNFQTHW